MAVEIISNKTTTNYECRIRFAFHNLENEYAAIEGEDGREELAFSKRPVYIPGGNGMAFEGGFFIFDDSFGDQGLMFALFKVRDLRAKLSGKLNGGGFGGVHIMDNNRCGASRLVNNVSLYGATFIIRNPFREKVKSIEGILELNFQANPSVELKQDLKIQLFSEIFQSSKRDMDFKIVANDGSEFEFSGLHLSCISDVFQKMIHNDYSKESSQGSVEIEDFSAETIRGFRNVIYGNENPVGLNEKELTADLMMFANKYAINALVLICSDHLKKSLNKDNIHDVIQAAYLINDDALLKTAMKFLWQNRGKLSRNEKWIAFKKSHPDCLSKLTDFFMYGDEENVDHETVEIE